MALLDIERLTVEFGAAKAPFRAVDGVDLRVEPGEVIGVVGESGSGKSVLSLAVLGLVEFPGRVDARRLSFDGRDLLNLSPQARRKLTGKDLAMIFQDPMTSLDPCYTVGFQIEETLKVHEGGSRTARRQRALALLEQVGIPDPASRLRAFPHQLSGGMSQRVMVMYAGQVVETGPIETVFAAPRHPYTAALLASLPERGAGERRLATLTGVVPGQYDRPAGCLLHPRCAFAAERCRLTPPALRAVGPDRQTRCHTPLDERGTPDHV